MNSKTMVVYDKDLQNTSSSDQNTEVLFIGRQLYLSILVARWGVLLVLCHELLPWKQSLRNVNKTNNFFSHFLLVFCKSFPLDLSEAKLLMSQIEAHKHVIKDRLPTQMKKGQNSTNRMYL